MNFQQNLETLRQMSASPSPIAVTGKELVSYEGADALVAALMGHYNEILAPASKDEIESILNQNLIKDVLELATEQDIRNLFVGTVLEGGETYNLSSLSTDESKVVNMRLLSLFNDLLLQKITGNKNELTNLINSIKRTLENSIALKEDKTKVAELLSALENKLTNLINLKANTTDVNKIKSDLTNLINGKAANTITVTGTGALSGGGDLTANRNISHKNTSGYKHIPSGGAINQFLKWDSDGTAIWSAIAWEVITGKKSIIAGTGLKGGGTLENNVTLSLDYGTAEEIKNILK